MNRLCDSNSLYLRQHADNPVHWQPWDTAALEDAKAQDRPILLSIGYSACHWCHVMAHESFEDPDTAQVMNSLFTNIKVDREERPDLDKIYQLSHQLLTGRGGGWPLTVFLDPVDHGAFFAGTYFPPRPRHGMPSFVELMRKVRDWFDQNRGAVTAQNLKLQNAIDHMQSGDGGEDQNPNDLARHAFTQLSERYDAEHGGFGTAPKFPQAPLLELTARFAGSSDENASEAITMLDHSLARMATSGLRDHLDGGFFRYTVDGDWTIPHFEKMLYDNAQLLPLYAEAASRSDHALLADAATGIASWLLNEMRQDSGLFSASIDADADGREGGFHVWDRDEIHDLLDARHHDDFAKSFGLDEAPNFEGRYWHLFRRDGAIGGHEDPLEHLRRARARRTPPTTDTKVLTAWNALCIDGLARAGSALGRDDWIDAATACWQELKRAAWKDQQLFAVLHGDQAQFPAYLDDHAYLLQASLSLLRARWTEGGLELARRLAHALLERFEDPAGGFRFTANDQPTPVARLRLFQDDATPNGNAVAAMALYDLAQLDGETRYFESAQRAVQAGLSDARRYPLAHATLLRAHSLQTEPPPHVLIFGTDDASKASFKEVAMRSDRVHCFVLPAGAGDRPALLQDVPASGPATALVCKNLRCLPPVTSPRDLEMALAEP